ncbi:MAG TPA: methyltransferase domain-containing protein [Gemmatimonadaceae bacterium]|nr:methyltransferase domain-containing protein [Gemmatimonadaceae bacterium]
MKEASKTNRVRDAEFVATYFAGSVLDIGSGPDPVVPHAQPFDRDHGDANEILRYLGGASFDTVHSSHCLEHMNDTRHTLDQWWSLVRPGGYLIITVPDEELYEQGFWPSQFNVEHRATFRLGGAPRSPVSHDFRTLLSSLPDAELIDVRRQDAGYDHSRRWSGPPTLGRALLWIDKYRRRRIRRHPDDALTRAWTATARWLHTPVDQTRLDALAQLHGIVRKRLSSS